MSVYLGMVILTVTLLVTFISAKIDPFRKRQPTPFDRKTIVAILVSAPLFLLAVVLVSQISGLWLTALYLGVLSGFVLYVVRSATGKWWPSILVALISLLPTFFWNSYVSNFYVLVTVFLASVSVFKLFTLDVAFLLSAGYSVYDLVAVYVGWMQKLALSAAKNNIPVVFRFMDWLLNQEVSVGLGDLLLGCMITIVTYVQFGARQAVLVSVGTCAILIGTLTLVNIQGMALPLYPILFAGWICVMLLSQRSAMTAMLRRVLKNP